MHLLPRRAGQGLAVADGGQTACRELQRLPGQLWIRRMSLLQDLCSSLQRVSTCLLLQLVHQEQVLADRGLVCIRQVQPLLR